MGDFTTNSAACIPGFPIGNYPPQWNGDATHNGQCPESIGLMQDRYLYHAEAFQGNNAVASTAYNVDYGFAVWRSCFEGERTWLNTVEHTGTYAAGDQLGCMGVWFSGRGRTPLPTSNISVVQGTHDKAVAASSFHPRSVMAVYDGGAHDGVVASRPAPRRPSRAGDPVAAGLNPRRGTVTSSQIFGRRARAGVSACA